MHIKTNYFYQGVSLALFLAFSLNLNAEVTYRDLLNAEEFPVGNMLEWSTEFEDDSDLFVIERSEDGINFFNIGKLEAAGDTDDGKKYHFLDVGVQNDKSFYRLKQVDSDGTAGYSHVVKLDKSLLNNFMVVRMNTTDVVKKFECTIDNLKEGTLNYQVSNLAGEVLYSEEALLTEGLNNIDIDTENFFPGIYKIHLKIGDERETLVIQRVETEYKPQLRASTEKKRKDG